MKGILFATFTALLLLGSQPAMADPTTSPRWMPKPWRQYLVRLEVERDTIVAPSVMLGKQKPAPKVDVSHFAVGAFWVPDPPSLFAEQDEWADRDRYRKGHLLGNIIEDVVNILLF